MAGKTKKRRTQKNRQKKQNKRKQRKSTSSPASHLSANGLRRLVRSVDLAECGLVESFQGGLAELDQRLRGYLDQPWQGESAWGYPELLNLRSEIEESMLSEERVASLMSALEKAATARRAYGALMAGLEKDSFIDVMWREVFSSLRETVTDPTLLLRARLFLGDYAPENPSEPLSLEAVADGLDCSGDELEQLQGQLLVHPALLRFAEVYSHLQARARFCGLTPLLTSEEAEQAQCKLQLGWAESVVESSLGRRVAQFFGLEGPELKAALVAVGTALQGGEPLDLASWSELQLNPQSAQVRLTLAAQQLAETPDEAAALLEGLEVGPEVSLHADEVLTSAYMALDQPDKLKSQAEGALARVAAGQLPEGLDPAVPRVFFNRFLSWLGPSPKIDWRASSDGVPTLDDSEGSKGLLPFLQSLDSGFRFAWETAIRGEQGLPLSEFQQNYLAAMPKEEGRLEYIDGMPRPSASWNDELNGLLAEVLEDEDRLEVFLDPESPLNWRQLSSLVRERAMELDNSKGVCDPLATIESGTRFELDRRWCLRQHQDHGPAALLGSMVQLRASLIEKAPELDEFLAPLGRDASFEASQSLKTWLNLEDGADLASRLALYTIS